MRSAVAALAAAALLVLAGCGASGGNGDSGGHPDYERALAGSPPRLAALHEEANELLPGGLETYEERLGRLRGFPVVANLWASWCGPCRLEFPHFQRAAAAFGKRVAFLGVDTEDSEEDAERFLAEEPVPYPSVTDPGKEVSAAVGGRGLPVTAFYDQSGELAFVKQGPYTDFAELRADIRSHALAGGAESG